MIDAGEDCPFPELAPDPLPEPVPTEPELPIPPLELSVKQVRPVGAALTQSQTALAEVITALSDAAGQAVITQGMAAFEIDAYVEGLHWQA